MEILLEALNKIKFIKKPQKKFFTILIQGLIGIVGNRTFRNLARYMKINEHTFSRQMAKAFDFIGLNYQMITASKKENDVFIGAQDATFISKSGKKTEGLNYFWNGCAGRVEKGLEIDVIAVVKVNDNKEAYAISAQQTLAHSLSQSERKKEKINDETKIDLCVDHLKKASKSLNDLNVKYMVADAFMTKYKYVNGVVELGFNMVGKLRRDAQLRRIYKGEQKSRGRKRKFDVRKVDIDDFKDSTVIKTKDENIELKSYIAYSVSLKREIKIVWVKKYMSPDKYGEAFLFSTDLELDTMKIYEFYVSRFQIEFIFRDAKGFTGLDDCQSRDSRRLHFHFNSSFVALNVAKIQDKLLQQNSEEKYSFSMASWSRKYHIDIILNRFISMFGFDQTSIKLNPLYECIISLGNIRY